MTAISIDRYCVCVIIKKNKNTVVGGRTPPHPPTTVGLVLPPVLEGFFVGGAYLQCILFVWVVKVYGVEMIEYTRWNGCGDEIHYVRESITRAIYC